MNIREMVRRAAEKNLGDCRIINIFPMPTRMAWDGVGFDILGGYIVLVEDDDGHRVCWKGCLHQFWHDTDHGRRLGQRVTLFQGCYHYATEEFERRKKAVIDSM